MGSFIEETTLHFEDDTFKKLRTDADQVLQKLHRQHGRKRAVSRAK